MSKSMFFVAAAITAVVSFGDGLAPLNPAFSKWRNGRMPLSSPKGAVGGNVRGAIAMNQPLRASGVVPSPFDRSYLKDFYVDGEAVSPLKPKQMRLLGAEAPIPRSYDTRVDGKGLTGVKDQNPYGTCWAHATCGCLEAWLLNAGKGTFNLSENNLANLHGRDGSFDDGGNGDIASAYLLRWSGPVLESSDPYPNIGGSPSNLEPILHLQNVKWIPGRKSATDNALIKKAVMKYGAVSVDYFHEPSAGGTSVDVTVKNAYWNPPEGAYYRSAYQEPNHEVCIVGWDDDYSAGKFSTRPPTDGAFLIKNSWGTGFGTAGNKGFCWISYHDATLAQGTSYVFADTEAVDNYDDIYQYDPLGLVGTYGHEAGGTIYGSAIFSAREDMKAAAVGIYLPEPYAKYEISMYSGCADGNPTSGTKLGSTSGNASEYAGYMTVPVSFASPISKGARFSVVVKITTASTRELAIEYPVLDYSSGASARYGETFVSLNGTEWSDFAGEVSGASFCCKVYAKRHVASSGTYTVKFAANGGTGTMADRTYSYGKSYTLPANAFTKDGYSFNGWTWSGGQFADCGEISFSSAVSSPLTLTAQWQKVPATKPSRPVIAEVTRGDLDSISVSWSAVPGAKRYNLYWCAIDEFPSGQTPISVTGTAYLDTERMPGLEIYYWVSAVNDAGESPVSSPVSGYRAATCSVTPVSASYSAAGAAGEVVTVEANTSWRVLDSPDWVQIEDGIGPEGVASFSYSVDANGSTQARSGTITVGTSAVAHRVTRTISICQAGVSKPLPGVPEMNKALYTSKGFYLSWAAASNAKTYKIYRSTNPDYFGAGETCIVSGLKATSYTDATANWLFAYNYRVAAVNDEGETSGPVVTLQGKLSGDTVVIPSLASGTFPADGGHASVVVDLIGSDAWEASSSASWLTLSATAGSSGGAFTVTAAKNTTSSKRVATVLVGAGYKIGGVYLASSTVTFTQEAGDGSGGSGGGATQADVTLPAGGGVEYAVVRTPAGEKWEFLLANRPSWVTGVSLGGTDMTQSTSFSVSANTDHAWNIGVTAAENTGDARDWAIPIMRNGVLIGSLVVQQRAAGEGGGSGGDDPDKIPIGGGTKTYSVTYAANEEWMFDISSRPAWVTTFIVDGQELTTSHISFSRRSTVAGAVVMSVTASANAGAERKWTIPITCGSASRGSVNVVQAGNATAGFPAAPGTPTVTAKNATTITVAWSKSDGATKYKLWRADNGKYGNADFRLIATLTGTAYTDSKLKPETTYSYKVSAVNAKGETMCPYMGSVTTPAQASSVETVPTSMLAFGPGKGSRFNISNFERAVVVGVSSLRWANFARRAYRGEQSEDDDSEHSFYTFDDSRIVDAEKNSTKDDFDDCWCSALSEMNVFFWAGWIGGYADEDAVKNYMRERADEVDYDTYGWDFYDLVSPDFSESVHKGGVAGMTQFVQAFEGADRLFCLTVAFDSDFIWKGEGGVSHGVVCCGYSLDTRKSAASPDALTGLFIIDSDSDMYNGAGASSAPDSITYCPVRWNASAQVYEIDNVFGATGTFSFGSMYYIRTRSSPSPRFTAETKIVTCKVSFNANGGAFADAADGARDVRKNAAIGALPIPSRTGYKFAGWYTKKSGGAKISASIKATKNVTYYAHWTVLKYRVFAAVSAKAAGTVGGAGAKAYRSKVTLKAKARKGYVFVRWVNLADEDVPWPSALLCRQPNVSFTMGAAPVSVRAEFARASADAAPALSLAPSDVWYVEADPGREISIVADSLSYPAVTVRGQPAGIGLVRVAGTDNEYVLKVTDASKMRPGVYTAKVTAKNRAGRIAAQSVRIVAPNSSAAVANGLIAGLETSTLSPYAVDGGMKTRWTLADLGVEAFATNGWRLVSVTGLPTGLSWNGTAIVGTALRTGLYTVTFYMQKKVGSGKKAKTYTSTASATFAVDALLPETLAGVYNGFVNSNVDQSDGLDGAISAPVVDGRAAAVKVTVTAAGQVAANVGGVALSGTGFDGAHEGVYFVTLRKTQKITKGSLKGRSKVWEAYIEIDMNVPWDKTQLAGWFTSYISGVPSATAPSWIAARRNVFGVNADAKIVAEAVAGTRKFTPRSVAGEQWSYELVAGGNALSLVAKSNGTLTLAGKIGSAKVSGTATLEVSEAGFAEWYDNETGDWYEAMRRTATARFFSGSFVIEVAFELVDGAVASVSGRVWRK